MSTGPDELRARRVNEMSALLSQIAYLEEEIGLPPQGGRQPAAGAQLEERIAEAEGRARLSERNDKLAGTLREAREQLTLLKEEVNVWAAPVGTASS